jgi:hypothetical protein
MNQPTQVLIGCLLGGASIFLLIIIRVLPRPRETPAPLSGVVRTGHRYCPAELRVRAAILHADGSATCGDCGAPIPASEA